VSIVGEALYDCLQSSRLTDEEDTLSFVIL